MLLFSFTLLYIHSVTHNHTWELPPLSNVDRRELLRTTAAFRCRLLSFTGFKGKMMMPKGRKCFSIAFPALVFCLGLEFKPPGLSPPPVFIVLLPLCLLLTSHITLKHLDLLRDLWNSWTLQRAFSCSSVGFIQGISLIMYDQSSRQWPRLLQREHIMPAQCIL